MLIYKVTNLINNKIYIGQTNDADKSYKGGGRLLREDIKIFGWENFKREKVVSGNFNQKLMDELERHYIQIYNSTNRNYGYNIQRGGKFGVKIHSEETKKLISKKVTGRIVSEETRKKYSLAKKGKLPSKETKKLIFENSILKKKVGQYDLYDNLLNIFDSAREAGRKLSIQYASISMCCRGELSRYKEFKFKYLSENVNTKYRKQTEETKQKISNKNGFPIYQLNKEGIIINSFKSIKEAENKTGIINTAICNVLNKRAHTAGGFKWKYQ